MLVPVGTQPLSDDCLPKEIRPAHFFRRSWVGSPLQTHNVGECSLSGSSELHIEQNRYRHCLALYAGTF